MSDEESYSRALKIWHDVGASVEQFPELMRYTLDLEATIKRLREALNAANDYIESYGEPGIDDTNRMFDEYERVRKTIRAALEKKS